MNEERTIKRGEIYMCDFGNNQGSLQNGLRPVIVMQEDNFNKNSPTVIVAPITTVIKKGYLPSHVYLGKKYGLSRNSMVLLEQIRTVNKTELLQYIGVVTSSAVMNSLWRSVKKTFGFWIAEKSSGNIISLCPDCLKMYLKSRNYNLYRMNRYSEEKWICDNCKHKYGYHYSVKERSKNHD